MSRTKTDFHFRVDPDTHARLTAATKAIKLQPDTRRKSKHPKLSDIIQAGIELVLRHVEAGVPIVDTEVLRARGAAQVAPDGTIYRAQPYSAEIYEELAREGRDLLLEEKPAFVLDAQIVKRGAEMVLRGNFFTKHPKLDCLIGERCIVERVRQGYAGVRFLRSDEEANVNVHDLAFEGWAPLGWAHPDSAPSGRWLIAGLGGRDWHEGVEWCVAKRVGDTWVSRWPGDTFDHEECRGWLPLEVVPTP